MTSSISLSILQKIKIGTSMQGLKLSSLKTKSSEMSKNYHAPYKFKQNNANVTNTTKGKCLWSKILNRRNRLNIKMQW